MSSLFAIVEEHSSMKLFFFFFSSGRRHTIWTGDWSSDVCSSDLAGWKMDRVFGPVRREPGCICNAGGRGRAAKVDVASRCRCRRGMDSGWKAGALLFRARSVCGFQPPLHCSGGGRSGPGFAYVARRSGVVLSRRDTNRLCAERNLADSLEALSRRADDADLYCEAERPDAGKGY